MKSNTLWSFKLYKRVLAESGLQKLLNKERFKMFRKAQMSLKKVEDGAETFAKERFKDDPLFKIYE